MSARHRPAKRLYKHTTALFSVGLMCVLLVINDYNIVQFINTNDKARGILLRAYELKETHCMQICKTKKVFFISEAKYYPTSPSSDIMANPLINPPRYRFSQLV
jgi:hypothetical protein